MRGVAGKLIYCGSVRLLTEDLGGGVGFPTWEAGAAFVVSGGGYTWITMKGGPIVRVQQTNLKLTPQGRAQLLRLAKRTRRSPRDVVEILLAQARVRDEPDIVLGGRVSVVTVGPDDAA
jgi:hypothetical protein